MIELTRLALGRCALRVTPICLGTTTFDQQVGENLVAWGTTKSSELPIDAICRTHRDPAQ
ncbi:MAG: hypothetical protein Q7T97_05770 [Burkholderiaceae bacterium]|nr:hypothetical protein [Burkholderiaceae bacterium]